MSDEKLPGCIGTVNLKPLRVARILLKQAEIVKRGADVKEFGVEPEILLAPLLRRKKVHAIGVVEKKFGGKLAQDIVRFPGQFGIGNLNRGLCKEH
jgi:hypothetical protein